MKQELSYKEKKINAKINEWIKLNLSEYYKTLTEDFTILKGTSFKEFSARIRDLILNGCEIETPKILSNYYFYTEEKLRRLNTFYDGIENTDTEELLTFDDDNKEFNEFEYIDSDDYYLETLNTVFNTNDISKYFNDNRGDTFIILNDEDFKIEIENEQSFYNTFKDFLEELENILDENINIEVLCMAYIYHHHYKVFSWFTDEKPLDEEIKEVVENIKKGIVEEIKKREKTLTKEIKKQKAEIIILEKYFKEIITNSNKYIENLDKEKATILKHIEDNKTKVV